MVSLEQNFAFHSLLSGSLRVQIMTKSVGIHLSAVVLSTYIYDYELELSLRVLA
jgi:hypothetical protein